MEDRTKWSEIVRQRFGKRGIGRVHAADDTGGLMRGDQYEHNPHPSTAATGGRIYGNQMVSQAMPHTNHDRDFDSQITSEIQLKKSEAHPSKWGLSDMKKTNILKACRKELYIFSVAAFGVGLGLSTTAMADSASCTVSGDGLTITCTGQYTPYDHSLNYENVIFNITGAWATSPDIQGVGIYANGGNRVARNNVTITTNGSAADAIRTNGTTTIIIPGKLIIRTEGSSGDGINATARSAATITIGDNAEIYSKGGIAVRANLSNISTTASNTITIGENAVLETIAAGANVGSATGYAVYAGNRDRESENMPHGNAKVTLGNGSQISTAGNNAYAVYANKTGQIQLGDTSITTTGQRAHGIVAMDGTIGQCPSSGISSSLCLAVGSSLTNVTHFDGGQVYLAGDTAINVDTSKSSYAIYSSGEKSLVTSGTLGGMAASGIFTVTGDLVADREGGIRLNATDGSVFNSNVNVLGTTTPTGTGNSFIDLTMSGTQLTGNIDASVSGTATLDASGNSVVAGNIRADTAGTVNFSADNSTYSGNVAALNSGNVQMMLTNGSHFVGSTNTDTTSTINLDVDGAASKWSINANSTLTALNLSSGATLEPYRVANELTSYVLRGAVTNNGGIINLTNGVAGDTLTIDGNYTAGGNARLLIDTILGDSSSVSDVLVINNGIVSGSTQVTVSNTGGLGAQTTGDGILIVATNNATIAGASFWAPANSIQAGLYAYNVVRGAGSPENWYLTSNYVPPPSPADPQIDPPIDPPTDSSSDPTGPTQPAGPVLPNIRDAVPVYMSAPALASKLGLAMLGTYHDRVGEDYSDVLLLPQQPKEEWCGSGKNRYRCQVARTYEKPLLAGWARLFGETGSVGYGGNGSPQERLGKLYKHGPSYDYNLAGFQAGMDLYRKEHANGIRDIAGVYFGYGNIDADVQAVYGGKAGTMSMDAYSFGAYWTRKGPSGWYIDAVAQGTIFDDIKGTTVDGYQMKTKGWAFTASLESGYPFALGNGWTIEPQAQLIYQHLSLDDSYDRAGRVLYGDTDTIYARVGARLTKEWKLANGHKLTTWARANLWHTFGDKGKTSFPTIEGGPGVMKTSLGGTWGQIGVGVSGQVNSNLRIFASGDYNMALDGGRGHSLTGRIGAKYVW